MTIENLVRQAIRDNVGNARGSAAGLGAAALNLAELSSELPEGAPPEFVKHAAHAIQARAHKALLGVLAATAAAARLEAYAHVLTLEAQAREAERGAAMARIESEAAVDVRTYCGFRPSWTAVSAHRDHSFRAS